MSAIVQTGITVLAVGLAVAYLGRNMLRQLRGGGKSHCDGCSASNGQHVSRPKQQSHK